MDIHAHPFIKVRWGIVEIVEHVIGEFHETETMSVADGLLIGFFETQVVEGYAERFDANSRKFAQENRILTKDSGIYALIEINPPLHRRAIALKLCSRDKPKISNLCDYLFETRGCYNVVVHKDEIFLGAVKLLNPLYDTGDRFGVALISFELRHTTKTALSDTAARGIREISIMYCVLVTDLIENAVVWNHVLNWLTKSVF